MRVGECACARRCYESFATFVSPVLSGRERCSRGAAAMLTRSTARTFRQTSMRARFACSCRRRHIRTSSFLYGVSSKVCLLRQTYAHFVSHTCAFRRLYVHMPSKRCVRPARGAARGRASGSGPASTVRA
eukprot:5715394-Pleurochrysis_carterae.AAC.1